MDRSGLRIVFLGNPEFARFQLQHLLEQGFNVVGVISAPDKAAGRGMHMHSTPVTRYAREQGIPLLQPPNLKDHAFQEELSALQADIQVVIAFRMLPETVWNQPPLGTINLHASLLPQYRGAAPINWAIMNGETQTGVTTFKLKHQIDTGNIYLQERCTIDPEDNAGSLHDKLMHLGADLVSRTLDGIISGEIEEQPQEVQADVKEAPKLFSQHCEIDWHKKGRRIHDQIRGLSPYPVAYTFLKDKRLKIYAAEFEQADLALGPGSIESDGKSYLSFTCADGRVQLKEVQMEGKRRMLVADFLRGFDPR